MKYLFFFFSVLFLLLTNKLKAEAIRNSFLINHHSLIENQHNNLSVPQTFIKNDYCSQKNNLKVANYKLSAPNTDKALFSIFSTLKIVSVLAIYQLFEKNKINLESNISEFITDLPVSWKKVKIKNLISHTSGLPDISKYNNDKEEDAKQKVYKDSIQFEPGRRFEYNKTNLWLINRIVKKVVDKTLSSDILESQIPNYFGSVIFENNNIKAKSNLKVN